MSRNLTESQLIAVHLLASGERPKEISQKLGIRPETLSRWRQSEAFKTAVHHANEDLLRLVSDKQKNLLVLTHAIIEDALLDQKTDLVTKSMIAIKFLSLLKGRDTMDTKVEKKLSKTSLLNSIGLEI